MSIRFPLSIVFFFCFLALPTLGVPIAPAEPQLTQPEVENSKFQFEAAINAANVQVRSGPGENYYPTLRLDKGAVVQVMGIKFDWLKIVPPDGSFSIVSKAFVERDAGGATGRVTADQLNIRAGSTLSNLKVTVQCKLAKGTVVTILGEVDEYYKIKPPAEAYVYVHKNFATPVKLLAGPKGGETPPLQTGSAGSPNNGAAAGAPAASQPSDVAATQPVVAQPATRPAVIISPATIQRLEAMAKSAEEFEKLETRYAEASAKSLESQPTGELLSAYEALVKNENLAPTMRQVAIRRAVTLQLKDRDRQALIATLKEQAEAEARLAGIRAEKATVEQRLAAGVTVYAAVGTLQSTTVKAGDGPLYRLSDPSTGRTLCYVRSADTILARLIDKFIGVKGAVGTDPQLSLKIVTATEAAEVDPAAVNKTISAQIVPPSLLNGKTEQQAGTGDK